MEIPHCIGNRMSIGSIKQAALGLAGMEGRIPADEFENIC